MWKGSVRRGGEGMCEWRQYRDSDVVFVIVRV